MTSQHIEQTLKGLGRRMTPIRRGIVGVVSDDHHAHTAAEILAELSKKGMKPNKTTVYRELESLCGDGVMQEIRLVEGPVAYELATDEHHHHAVCSSCHSITEVEFTHDFEAIEHRLAKTNGFRVQGHAVSFTGVCRSCA